MMAASTAVEAEVEFTRQTPLAENADQLRKLFPDDSGPNLIQDSHYETTIKSVCTLLESGSAPRQKIWLRRDEVYDYLLLCVEGRINVQPAASVNHKDHEEILEERESSRPPTIGSTCCVNRRYGVLHSAVRAILKMEQLLFWEWKADRRTWSHRNVRRITKALIDVMKDRDCPSDIVFLAGTAFSFLLHSLDGNPSERALLFVKTFFGEHTDQALNLSTTVDAKDVALPHHALPLMHGLFACGKSDILLSESVLSSSSSIKPVLSQLLPWIVKFCEMPGNSGREYQSFQTLVAWLRWVQRNTEQLTVPASAFPFVDVVISLLDVGWCSPVTGVADLSWDAYRILLEIHSHSGAFVLDQLHTALILSWTCKGKYPRLATIVKYVGASKLLIERPHFLKELSESLASNRLSSASRIVYRAFSIRFLSEMSNLHSLEDLCRRWEVIFLPSLSSALRNSNSLTLHNAIRHWLPVTLQVFPFALEPLMQHLGAEYSRSPSAEALLVMMSTLRLARNEGVVDSSWALKLPFVDEALRHVEDEVRAEAFAVVCSSRRKSELVSDIEKDFVRAFLPINLNVDSASFRRMLFSNFKCLLIRLRDFCIKLCPAGNILTEKKVSKEDFKSKPAIEQSSSLELSDTAGTFMILPVENGPLSNDLPALKLDFLDYLIGVCQSGLVPGGCYQRRTTCLGLYKCALDVFVSTPSSSTRKGVVPVACERLLDYLRKRGKCSLLDDTCERRLVFCVMDPMDDVQATAVSILARHFAGLPSTTRALAAGSKGSVVDWALRLCVTPKTMYTHSGANLLSLVCRHADCGRRHDVLGLILAKLSQQLDVAKKSLAVAASSSPMHGLLLALRLALCFDINNLHHRPGIIGQFLEKCFHITEEIVQCVLGALSARSSKDSVAPSFGEMDGAIDDIVVNSYSSDFKSNYDRSTRTSSDHQLVLSCCWLSLKESCLLLGNLVHFYLDSKDDNDASGYLSVDRVRRAARTLLSVLTRCRHRGVIESCDAGFELLCKRLLDSGRPSLMSIVSDILDKALVELEAGVSAMSTSVTRRSAGLPLLVATIVRSDRRPSTPLLTDTIRRLLIVAQEPLPELSPLDDGLVDVPQARAFHVLKALVHDAALSQDILRDVAPLTMVCLYGFYSSSWAVRNAVLQLFGALVPVIIGQKKATTNDEDDVASKHGGIPSMTFSEFFARWPQLGDAIEEHLSVELSLCLMRPTVVPILSLLCSLDTSPDNDNEVVDRLQGLAELVRPLLASNVWHVRRLAALFMAKACSPPAHQILFFDVCRELAAPQNNDTSEVIGVRSSNGRHGRLLLLKRLAVAIISPFSKVTLVKRMRQALNEVVRLSVFVWPFCPVLIAAALEICAASPQLLRPSNSLFSHLKESLNANDIGFQENSTWKPGFGLLPKRMHQAMLCAPASTASADPLGPWPTQNATDDELEAFTIAIKTGLQFESTRASRDDHEDEGGEVDNIDGHLLEFLKASLATGSSPVLIRGLEMAFDVYTKMGMKITPRTDALRFVKSLVHDKARGRFASAIGLAVWATIIDAHANKDGGDKLDVMSDVESFVVHLRRFCESQLSEHFRLWAAKALNKATSLLCMIESMGDWERTKHENILVSVFDSSVTLLQDEQPDVRREATKIIDRLYLRTVNLQTTIVHPNVAMQMLAAYFIRHFGWSRQLFNHLWDKIGGFDYPSAFFVELSTAGNTRSSSLFQQEDVNVYAEKCFMSRCFYAQTIQSLLSSETSSGSTSRQIQADQVLMRASLTMAFLTSCGVVDLELHCRPKVARQVANLLAQLDVVFALTTSSTSNTDLVQMRDELQRRVGLQ